MNVMRRVLVTGATGSFGKAFVQSLLDRNPKIEIVCFSRDELKQFEMQSEFNSERISFALGDVRDYKRVLQVCEGVDTIIHAAAMKQIPAAELNPMEAIKTNVLGAENIINAAIESSVSKVVALSTDKAANPANLYGATKLCSDKLMVAGNLLVKNSETKFSVVRYGNVLGSRGSVVPFFLEMKRSGLIPITDERMTRFWLTLSNAVDLVFIALSQMKGGEIFVPKIPSFKVTDVARLVAPGVPIRNIGIRPGEKLHEIMITEDDSLHTLEHPSHYRILSPLIPIHKKELQLGSKVPAGFSYRSDNNIWWHTDESFLSTLKEIGLV
jgi:UDP-N-acetylglucosamine 4,6-dehydratase/5-epimerase